MRDRDPMATPFRFRLKVEGLFYNTTEGSRVEKKNGVSSDTGGGKRDGLMMMDS